MPESLLPSYRPGHPQISLQYFGRIFHTQTHHHQWSTLDLLTQYESEESLSISTIQQDRKRTITHVYAMVRAVTIVKLCKRALEERPFLAISGCVADLGPVKICRYTCKKSVSLFKGIKYMHTISSR